MWHDLRYAFRSLSRAPGFTGVAVLTLALGIGANTAIFSQVYATLLKPLPFRDPARLIAVWDTYLPQYPKIGVSPVEFEASRAQSDLFEGAAWFRSVISDMALRTQGAEALEVRVTFVSTDLFPLLGVTPLLGRAFASAEAPTSVLVSERLWRTRFQADRQVLGRSIRLDDLLCTVVGVVADQTRFPEGVDAWLPPGPLLGDETSNAIRHSEGMVARLRPGVTVEQASTRIQELFRRLAAERPRTSTGFGVRISSLRDDLSASTRPALLLLLSAVGLVLLIACVNVANLLLSRAIGRTREIAVRVAIGASHWRLIRQLLTESLVLGALGGLAGVALAKLVLVLAPDAQGRMDAAVLGFALLVSVVSSVAFGLVPALQTLRVDTNSSIKAGSVTGSGSALRSTLVVVEFAVALVLVVGAAILLKSFARLLNVNPGFESKAVLTLRLSPPPSQQSQGTLRRIEERLRELPGVESVAMSNGLPLTPGIAFTRRFNVPGSPLINPDALPGAQTRFVTPDYFRAMRIPLRAGRVFTDRDLNQPVVIVNESMARRFWPGRDPIGERYITGPFGPNPTSSTIIGVVGDVKQFGLDSEPTMDEYFPGAPSRFAVVRTAGDPAALAGAARLAIREVSPEIPVSEVRTLDELIAESAASRRVTLTLLGAFAALALVLALVGIYGVLSGSVARRSREIGIRMALGAQSGGIARMIVGHVMKLAVVGLAAGIAASLALRRVLSTLVFEVSTADPLVYTGVAVLMLAAALLAGYIPARRAARVDPLVALRQD